jgi:hypothetical protein
MKPSLHSTLMEFFPTGYFSREQELPARYLGTRYIAWWGDRWAHPTINIWRQLHIIGHHFRKFTGNSLPPTVQPHEGQLAEIGINPTAIIKAIREQIDIHRNWSSAHCIKIIPIASCSTTLTFSLDLILYYWDHRPRHLLVWVGCLPSIPNTVRDYHRICTAILYNFGPGRCSHGCSEHPAFGDKN